MVPASCLGVAHVLVGGQAPREAPSHTVCVQRQNIGGQWCHCGTTSPLGFRKPHYLQPPVCEDGYHSGC
eukprot:7762382-Alexandrium_andersonii.AAC.1